MNPGFIFQQLFVFFCLFLLGMLMGVVFDLIGIFKRTLNLGKIKVFVFDLLSCLIFAFIVFYVLFVIYLGQLRFFVFLAIFIGTVVHYRYCSAFVVEVFFRVFIRFIKIKKEIAGTRRIIPRVGRNSRKNQ